MTLMFPDPQTTEAGLFGGPGDYGVQQKEGREVLREISRGLDPTWHTVKYGPGARGSSAEFTNPF